MDNSHEQGTTRRDLMKLGAASVIAGVAGSLPLAVSSVHAAAPTADRGLIKLTGTIKWFDDAKGIGRINPDQALPNVLLHVTCLRAAGIQTVKAGDRVECEVLQRPRGLQAYRILKITPDRPRWTQTISRPG